MSKSQSDINGQQVPLAEQEREKRECCCSKIHSKAVLLVLFWTMMMFTLDYTVFRYAIIDVPAINFLNARGLPATLVTIFLGPIIGWVADVYLGLYKAMKISLWLGWIGSMACTVTELTPLLTDKIPQQAITALRLTCGVTVCIGVLSLSVISLVFAIEQMPDASGDNQSVIIRWYVWMVYTGRALSNIEALIAPCSNLPNREAEVFRLLITSAILTIVICSDALCHQYLTEVPERRNTWGTIWRVVKYAVTHKYPAKRSALTYCEDSIPSRMDLGKHKYGGPFTTEQVEDVKTFIQVLAVVLSMVMINTPTYLITHSEEGLIHHFSGDTTSTCNYSIISTLYSMQFLVAVFIPLYEFIIHPWGRNRMPQMLQRLVVAAVIVVFMSLFLLIIDAVGHYLHDAPCMFCAQRESQMSISYLAVLVPFNTMFAVSVTISMIALFEFICAQAPYSMKGLLIGLGMSIIFASEGIASVIELGWYIGWQKTQQLVTTPSCEFWYYLFTTVLAIIGVIVMGFVAKYYKPRQRDEPNNIRIFVENYYDKYCINPNMSV